MPGEVHATPLEVEGWAWSESGIDRVVVQIDDELEYDAFLGIPRPDIAVALQPFDSCAELSPHRAILTF